MIRASSRRGFTLVEMLVAVAILAVLAALLLPGLRNAVERARQAKCAGQLRQIYAGVVLYAGDNNGAYITGSGHNWYWCTALSPLAPYLGGTNAMEQIVVCPSRRGHATNLPVQFGTNGWPYTICTTTLTIPWTNTPPPLYPVTLRDPGSLIMMADPMTTNWSASFSGINGSRTAIGTPHLGLANILWCDGHVAAQLPTTVAFTNTFPQ